MKNGISIEMANKYNSLNTLAGWNSLTPEQSAEYDALGKQIKDSGISAKDFFELVVS